mgnify:CR=1 FL=1
MTMICKKLSYDSMRYMELLQIAKKTGQVLSHADRQSLLLSIVRTTKSPSLKHAGEQWQKNLFLH